MDGAGDHWWQNFTDEKSRLRPMMLDLLWVALITLITFIILIITQIPLITLITLIILIIMMLDLLLVAQYTSFNTSRA